MGTQTRQDREPWQTERPLQPAAKETPSTKLDDHDDVHKERRLQTHGLVLAIGSHEDKDVHGKIFPRFIDVAGGKQSWVVIIPKAASDPDAMIADYRNIFEKPECSRIKALWRRGRDDANSSAGVDLLNQTTGVFVTVGDEARLVERIIETRVMDTIRVRNAEGSRRGNQRWSVPGRPTHDLGWIRNRPGQW
jgi:cyanophycinase-like exopeptidase